MERNRVGAEQHTNSQIPKEGSAMTNLKHLRWAGLVLLMAFLGAAS
jgi:hypothetical protein